MNIRSAKFVKSVVEADEILEDKKPQIAFIGRSNVGKSSMINSLTKVKGLAKTSSFPGRTQLINIFLINKSHYFVDLPGYGYARLSGETRAKIRGLIFWYFFESEYKQEKIVFIIDANVGLTANDIDMLESLNDAKKTIIVVANKIDKLKKSHVHMRLKKIQEMVGKHKVIPYSSEKGIGISELTEEIMK